MPVPRHVRISFRGRLNNTPEIWSHSHNLNRPAAAVGFDLTHINLDDLAAAWTTMAATCLDSFVHLTDVRVYAIGTNGRMEGNPHYREYATADEPKGGGSGQAFPPQIALCVTTEAPNRGPARFGRYYLPLPAVSLESDLRISEARATQILGAQRTFLLALRDAYGTPAAPDVIDLPPVNVSTLGGGGAGSQQNITRVRVGRVLDTIRRRRNAMDEAYTTVAL